MNAPQKHLKTVLDYLATMKWYIAARRRCQAPVSQLFEILVKEGHEVIFNWTKMGKVGLAHENVAKNRNLADLMGYAITNSDVFMMMSDAEGTDMYLELGMAILNKQREQKPRVYSIGTYGYGSLMQHHPSIEHTASVMEVFMKECPEIAEKYKTEIATIDDTLRNDLKTPSKI